MSSLPATPSAAGARTPGWTLAGAAFACALLVLLACYWRTAWSLVSAWAHDGTYQYAFLIFPLSAWVAFDLRRKVLAQAPKPSVWGVVAVAVLVLVWCAGHAVSVNLAQHFAFVALFPALVLACWGWRAAWTLMFPLAYLVAFAVPWGDALVGPLQDITAHIAVHVLVLTGMPVLLNGREIMTPSAVWMVADACSGVKFFIACMALGCLYGWLMYQRWWKRMLFVVLAAVVPVIANGLRVYFTVLIGETWGMHYATGTDHLIFGWQFFGTVLVLLLLAGWFFRDPVAARTHVVMDRAWPSRPRMLAWLAVLAALVGGSAFAARMTPPAAARAVTIVAPAVAGWHGPQPVMGGWQPQFKGATGHAQADYAADADGVRVGLFHALYLGRSQRGHDLVTYGNDVYDPQVARILSTAGRRVEFAGGGAVDARELRLAGANGTRLVWYWYCVNGRCTASAALTKLLQAWGVLRGESVHASVWAVSAPTHGADEARVRDALRRFAAAMPAPGADGTRP